MSHNEQHKCGCTKPEHLKGKPEECSPEQIRECHGEGAGHPCCDSEAEST